MQVNSAWWRTTGIALGIALGTCLFAITPSANATDTQAQLQVTARVVKFSRLKLLSQHRTIHITPSDLARGYLEVPEPVQMAVQSNSPDGFTLVISARADYLKATTISGTDTSMTFSGEGLAHRRGSNPGQLDLVELRIRLDLSESAQPGTYRWPLQLSVMPS